MKHTLSGSLPNDTVSFVLVKSWMHRGACLGASGLGARSAVGSTSAMVKFVEVCACCHGRGRLGVLGVVCLPKAVDSIAFSSLLTSRLRRLVLGEVDALVSHVQSDCCSSHTLLAVYFLVCYMSISSFSSLFSIWTPVGEFLVLFLRDAGDEFCCGDCGDFSCVFSCLLCESV